MRGHRGRSRYPRRNRGFSRVSWEVEGNDMAYGEFGGALGSAQKARSSPWNGDVMAAVADAVAKTGVAQEAKAAETEEKARLEEEIRLTMEQAAAVEAEALDRTREADAAREALARVRAAAETAIEKAKILENMRVAAQAKKNKVAGEAAAATRKVRGAIEPHDGATADAQATAALWEENLMATTAEAAAAARVSAAARANAAAAEEELAAAEIVVREKMKIAAAATARAKEEKTKTNASMRAARERLHEIEAARLDAEAWERDVLEAAAEAAKASAPVDGSFLDVEPGIVVEEPPAKPEEGESAQTQPMPRHGDVPFRPFMQPRPVIRPETTSHI